MKNFLMMAFAAVMLFSCKSTGGSAGRDGKLYMRTVMWSGTYGSSTEISWIYLGDDGTIVYNPKHGVDPINMQEEKKDNAAYTGTYKIEGNKINVTWSNGKAESWTLEKDGSKYSAINGGLVSEPEALPNNYKLEGKFSAGGVLPNVASSSDLVFKNDGTFTLSDLVTVSTEGGGASANNLNAGKYEINGNTLVLNFNNGTKEISPITKWESGKRFLVIGPNSYPEEK